MGHRVEIDEEGITLCTARPEFAALSHYEVQAAVVQDDSAESPVMSEIMRLIVEFLDRLEAYAEEHGVLGQDGADLHVEAKCPMEKVAILAAIHYVAVRIKVRTAGRD